MSTTTVAPTNLIEYVRSLTPADKNAALVELLAEVTRTRGTTGLIPLHDANGEPVGYFVPPIPTKERVQAMVERMTPEERQRGDEALKDLSKTFDVEEFFNELDREDRG
jgi:hypothetical protein